MPCFKNSHLRKQMSMTPAHLAKGAHAIDLVRYNLERLPRLVGDLVCPGLRLETSHHLQGEWSGLHEEGAV